MHAVDVGPDLYLLGIEHGTDDRGCIVAAAAFEIVDAAVVVAAYIALGEEDLGFGLKLNQTAKVRLDVRHVGLSAVEGAHIVESRQKHRLDTARQKQTLHDGRRHKLSLGKNLFLAGSRERGVAI